MKLKKYLNLHHIKQIDFCKLVGIKPSHMSLIVNGKALPSIKVAKKIARQTGGSVTIYDY